MKNSKIDSVRMVREIRDKNYEATKGMSRQELLEQLRKQGQKAKEQFNNSSGNDNSSSD